MISHNSGRFFSLRDQRKFHGGGQIIQALIYVLEFQQGEMDVVKKSRPDRGKNMNQGLKVGM